MPVLRADCGPRGGGSGVGAALQKPLPAEAAAAFQTGVPAAGDIVDLGSSGWIMHLPPRAGVDHRCAHRTQPNVFGTAWSTPASLDSLDSLDSGRKMQS